jgi:membrane dipeptidase
MIVGSIFMTAAVPLSIAAGQESESLHEKARRIHREAIVVDTHSDTTSRILHSGVDISGRLSDGHQDIPRMVEGGLDAQFYSIYVPSNYAGDGATRRAIEMIDALYRTVDANAEKMELAHSVSDLYRIVGSGKIAALMGLEGGHALENSTGVLRTFHRLGIRYVTLTHIESNDWADSSGGVARWGGLNELGEEMVREMNRIGMIVDVSHVSDETFWDVLRISRAPVIASHSSCRELADWPRNMSDEMIEAMAERGGLIMINFGSPFLHPEWARRIRIIVKAMEEKGDWDFSIWREMWDEMEEKEPAPRVKLSDLIDHIDHTVRIAGPDHVGLGSDFDGVRHLPEGLDDVSDLPAITLALLERGYTEADVRKILGGNLLRVLGEVERAAARQPAPGTAG